MPKNANSRLRPKENGNIFKNCLNISKMGTFASSRRKVSNFRCLRLRRRGNALFCVLTAATFLCIYLVISTGSGILWSNHLPSSTELKVQNHTRIFFLETSGKGYLSLRQCAAVESAAFWNPSKQIQVYLFDASSRNYTPAMAAIEKVYHNVKYTAVRMLDIVLETPLEYWYVEGKWRRSKTPAAHTSDGLRFLELWKSGGIYLDLDVMTLRELRFPKNAVIWENTFYIASGILAFQSKHPLMSAALKHFVDFYDPDQYVVNGPPVVTKEYHLYKDAQGERCDVALLPVETASPLIWEDGNDYFDEKKTVETLRKTEKSLAAHWWNDLNHDRDLPSESKCAFMMLVKRYCPLTYARILKEGSLGGP